MNTAAVFFIPVSFQLKFPKLPCPAIPWSPSLQQKPTSYHYSMSYAVFNQKKTPYRPKRGFPTHRPGWSRCTCYWLYRCNQTRKRCAFFRFFCFSRNIGLFLQNIAKEGGYLANNVDWGKSGRTFFTSHLETPRAGYTFAGSSVCSGSASACSASCSPGLNGSGSANWTAIRRRKPFTLSTRQI